MVAYACSSIPICLARPLSHQHAPKSNSLPSSAIHLLQVTICSYVKITPMGDSFIHKSHLSFSLVALMLFDLVLYFPFLFRSIFCSSVLPLFPWGFCVSPRRTIIDKIQMMIEMRLEVLMKFLLKPRCAAETHDTSRCECC